MKIISNWRIKSRASTNKQLNKFENATVVALLRKKNFKFPPKIKNLKLPNYLNYWTQFTILDEIRLVDYNNGYDFCYFIQNAPINITIFSHSVKFRTTLSTTINCFTHLPLLKLSPFSTFAQTNNQRMLLCLANAPTYVQIQYSKYL